MSWFWAAVVSAAFRPSTVDRSSLRRARKAAQARRGGPLARGGAFDGAGAAGVADGSADAVAVGSTLGVAVAGEAVARPFAGGGLGLSAISAAGFPRPSVATRSATAATAT